MLLFQKMFSRLLVTTVVTEISSLILYSCHVHFAVHFINFISTDILGLYCSLIAQVSHPYNKVGNAKAFYIFSLVCFWTCWVFEVLLIILIIGRNFDILTVIYFSFWYEIDQPRSWKVFVGSILLLFIVILLLTGSLSLKAIAFI